MKKVAFYSFLLIAGLIGSQFMQGAPHWLSLGVKLTTMFALSFIMIHVGYEFEIDKSRLKSYGFDYVVAASAAMLPWIFCTLYFIFAMSPRELWGDPDRFKASLLEGLFAAPTSAGVLFSMLAAAGLGATWLFRKARILAIFDDLQTILLLIPLKILLIGWKWQLAVIAIIVFTLLWVAYRYLNALRLPVTWPWVMTYAGCVVFFSELIYWTSKHVDPNLPIHLEVLLPAFAIGCVLRTPDGQDPHSDDAKENVEEGPEMPDEQFASAIVSAVFMVLVGLSMPPIFGASAPGHDEFPGWGIVALHVVAITLLSNLGKMVPAVCYQQEASWRERLALAIGMFPRGEVGAGVLLIALGYGLGGTTLTVAVLSLALNLLCTGLFIMMVKRLLRVTPDPHG